MSDRGDPSEVDEGALRPGWVARAPIVAFSMVEVVALVVWLGIGRTGWFYNDDWDFLALRTAGNLGDVFRPHNGHWTTLPILIYRFLFELFGLRFYLPYRLVVLVMYLAAAALLLVVMRRAGVNPWIASAAASLFALFGSGWQNILRPFQMTFTGALLFGVVALLLADHDGRFDRRDVCALIAGLVALMMSGVGVVMVAVVGIATLLRRGWRAAVVQVAPLAAIYLVWLIAIGHQGGVVQSASVARVVNFVETGLRGGFRELGPYAWFAAPFAVMLVGGFALAARQRPKPDWAPLAAPFALLCGTALVLAAAAFQGRAIGNAGYARQSRYLSLVAAMSLPALAVAADALTRRWRWLVPIAVALFLVGIPHNIDEARSAARTLAKPYAATRLIVETVPRNPLARKVPPRLEPDEYTAPDLTVGWLVGALDRHDIASPGPISRRDRDSATFRLSFYQDNRPGPSTHCTTLRRPLVVALKTGAVVRLSGGPLLLTPATPVYLYPGLVFGLYTNSVFDLSRGNALHVVHRVGKVRLAAFYKRLPPRVCIS